MTNIESTVEKCYRALLGSGRGTEPVDMNRLLAEEDGLSSLQLVTFVTTVCEEVELPLTVLTEHDIARMKTANDIVTIIRTAFAGSRV